MLVARKFFIISHRLGDIGTLDRPPDPLIFNFFQSFMWYLRKRVLVWGFFTKSYAQARDLKFAWLLRYESYAMTHTKRVHGPVENPLNPWLKHDPELANRFSCDICGKTFASEFDFKYHRRLNHEKTFECPLCPEKFKRRQNVEAHLSKFYFILRVEGHRFK